MFDLPVPTFGCRVADQDFVASSNEIVSAAPKRGLYAATRLTVTDATHLVAGARLAKWSEVGTSYGSPVDFGIAFGEPRNVNIRVRYQF